jgi:hypothetical protein
MVLQAINLGILTLLFFVVGMIKPKWSLFFMEKPTRWLVTMITTVFFMISMTMYGQGIKEAKRMNKPKVAITSQSKAPAPETVPVPVPVPVDTPKPVANKK